MAGCDYLESLPGIGIGKSLKFWGKVTQPSLELALPKIPGYLNMKKIQVTDEYVRGFVQGIFIFTQSINDFNMNLTNILPLYYQFFE